MRKTLSDLFPAVEGLHEACGIQWQPAYYRVTHLVKAAVNIVNDPDVNPFFQAFLHKPGPFGSENRIGYHPLHTLVRIKFQFSRTGAGSVQEKPYHCLTKTLCPEIYTLLPGKLAAVRKTVSESGRGGRGESLESVHQFFHGSGIGVLK